MAIKRGSKVEVGSSSASMTDLIFLLLIFLLIATTMISPNAIKLALPQSSTANKDKAMTTVSITADLQYFIETERVSFEQIRPKLQARLEGVDDPTVSLHCDKTVAWEEVVRMMNLARDMRFKLIAATLPE